MDGDHDIDACARVTEWVLKEVFSALFHAARRARRHDAEAQHGDLGQEMPEAGERRRSGEREPSKILKRCVPAAVPGIAFLSGGQSDRDATAHLNAMNARYDLPWPLTFSYGRALQAAPQKAWSGKPENVPAAQKAFAHRAQMNGLAATGAWKSDLEKAA